MKEEGFIYVLTNEELTICKIGFSKHPDKRLKQVQTGCPFKLSLYFSCQGDTKQEKMLHNFFSEDYLHGEWFTFSEFIKMQLAYMQVIINVIENYDENKVKEIKEPCF